VRAPVLLAIVIAACSSKTSDPPPPTTQPPPPPPPVAVADAATAPAPSTSPIPAATLVLVTSITPDWDATTGELAVYRRDASTAAWRRDRAWPATVGHAGLAWGAGLHGAGAPSDRDGPVKREGDGKAPAGAFTLDAAYGYAAAPPAGTRLRYTAVDPTWHCVDDPKSRSYNKIVDEDDVAKDWSSAEDMRRDDALYTWVVDVGHNRAATPGGGSCIFLHVWSGPKGPTLGCTSMAKPALEKLLVDLDPAAHPVLVQLTAAEYDALASAWQLPPR
jgi:D-alanyl-D-alanine dipeptidase